MSYYSVVLMLCFVLIRKIIKFLSSRLLSVTLWMTQFRISFKKQQINTLVNIIFFFNLEISNDHLKLLFCNGSEQPPEGSISPEMMGLNVSSSNSIWRLMLAVEVGVRFLVSVEIRNLTGHYHFINMLDVGP